jgi:hypothetical protein
MLTRRNGRRNWRASRAMVARFREPFGDRRPFENPRVAQPFVVRAHRTAADLRYTWLEGQAQKAAFQDLAREYGVGRELLAQTQDGRRAHDVKSRRMKRPDSLFGMQGAAGLLSEGCYDQE